MKKIIQFLLVVFLLSFTSTQAFARVDVVATTQDIAAITKAVGKKHVDVISLTKGSRDPHFATAKPSMIRKLFHANLLVLVGAELETGWLPALIQSARNSNVQPGNPGYLDLSMFANIKGKPKVNVTRDMGDVHAAGNPHYWLDPENGILMAKAIADKLSEIDQNNAQEYQANANLFSDKLNAKIIEWKTELAFLRNMPVITYHTSMLYLADTFGLRIADHIEPKPGITPGASHLNKLVSTIKEKQIQLILMEPYYEKRSAQLLNRKTGIKIAVVPQSVGAISSVTDYISLFDEIVKTIKSISSMNNSAQGSSM